MKKFLTIKIILFIFLSFSCSRQETGEPPQAHVPKTQTPVLNLHLDGWGSRTAGFPDAQTGDACRTRFPAGGPRHAGPEKPREPGAADEPGALTEAFLPAGDTRTQTPGARRHMRPFRTPRMRMESIACPGTAPLQDKSGKIVRTLQVSACSGSGARVDPGPGALSPGPAGQLAESSSEMLAPGQTRTWIWRESGELWAVSVGVLHTDATRVVWHREGPVRGALFGPADRIALRDGQIGIHMQADFILGSLRALFAVLREMDAPRLHAVITETADLEEALAVAPGSWDNPLRELLAGEIHEFIRDRAAFGRQVLVSGETLVTSVLRRVDPAALGTPAERVRVTPGGLDFMWVRPDAQTRLALENALAKAGIGPQTDAFLRRIPDGWRLVLPPGWTAGRCPRGAVCRPDDGEGTRISGDWVRPWCAVR